MEWNSLEYSAQCFLYTGSLKKQNNVLLAHKGRGKAEPAVRGLVYMRVSFSCEWQWATGRLKERKSTLGSNDNKQIRKERRSLWTFPVRKSAFFPELALAIFFLSPHSLFLFSLPPLFPPEISFQHAKPCKNSPRVPRLRAVCKDVQVDF